MLWDSSWPHESKCQGLTIMRVLRWRNCCDFLEEAEVCTAIAPKAKSATYINVLYTKTTQPKEAIIMNKYVVCFNVYPDFQKIRRRTVQARDKQEAIAKVSHEVPGSFYHYIKETK